MSYRNNNEKLKNPRDYVIGKIEAEFIDYERYLQNQIAPLREKKCQEIRKRLKLPQMEALINKKVAELNMLLDQYRNVAATDRNFIEGMGGHVSFRPMNSYADSYGQRTMIGKLVDQELGLTKYGEMLKVVRAKKDQMIEDIVLSKSPDLKAILAELPAKLEEVKKLLPVKKAAAIPANSEETCSE